MIKRSFLVLVLVMLVLFSSCGEAPYPKELEGIIKTHSTESWHDLEYSGQRYICKKQLFTAKGEFSQEPYEGDVLISWNRGLKSYALYYSETDESPLFIYDNHYIYLREDYDYTSDTFFLSGTDESFVFSEYFNEIELGPSGQDYKHLNVSFISKTNPRLEMRISIFCVAGSWYASEAIDWSVFTVSDEFIEFMKQCGYITDKDIYELFENKNDNSEYIEQESDGFWSKFKDVFFSIIFPGFY